MSRISIRKNYEIMRAVVLSSIRIPRLANQNRVTSKLGIFLLSVVLILDEFISIFPPMLADCCLSQIL